MNYVQCYSYYEVNVCECIVGLVDVDLFYEFFGLV